MPTLSSLLSPLLPQTRQVLGFIDQGLLHAVETPGKQPVKEARGALGRLILLAQVEEEHPPQVLHRLIKHAEVHLQALDSESFGRLFVSDEPVLAVRTLYTELRALTASLAPETNRLPAPLLLGGPVPDVDDLMLQAACDAYAHYSQSVGEPGEYFPDAMKAALEAAMKVQGHQNWIRRMADLEEEAGGETTAGIPFALQFIPHPQGDPQ